MVLLRAFLALCRALAQPRRPLPFLGMAARYGLTFPQIEEVVPLEEIHRAVTRCNDCAARHECGSGTSECPNAPLFRRALGSQRSLS